MNVSFTSLARLAGIRHASLGDTVVGSDRFKVSPANFTPRKTRWSQPPTPGIPETATAHGRPHRRAGHTRAQFFGNSRRPFPATSGYGDRILP